MRDEYVHDAIEPLLIEYAAGVLDADDRRKVESHLMNCDSCRAALDEWRQIAAAARRETPSRTLPPLDWRLIKGERPMILAPPRTALPRRTTLQFTAPALLTVMLAGAVALFGMMGGGPSNESNFASAPVIEQEATDVDPTEVPVITATPISATTVPGTDRDETGAPPPVTWEPTVEPPADIQYVDGYNYAAIPDGMRPVLVAANNIENGSVIMPHDLTVYLIDEATVPEGATFNPDAILYTIAAYNISCGQILTLDYGVVNAREVAPGQPVLQIEGCLSIIHTHNPNANSVARHYNAVLYPQPVGETASVLLFARDIDAGTVITEEDVIPAPDYPIELVPPAALDNAEAIVGRTLAAPVVAGQIVMSYAAGSD